MKLIPAHRSCLCAALMAAVGVLAMAAPVRSQIASRTTEAPDCRPSFRNFVRNSIALSTCDQAHGWRINYYWENKNRSKPTAFFDTKEKEYWYWPLDGFLYRGRLYVAISKLKNKPNEEVFSFETVGVYLAVVTNLSATPDQWGLLTLFS
jgi:hypothetical protein